MTTLNVLRKKMKSALPFLILTCTLIFSSCKTTNDYATNEIESESILPSVSESKYANSKRKVLLKVTIGIDGRVEEAIVIESTSDELSERALKIAKQARFTPPVVNGTPSKVTANWPVVFEEERAEPAGTGQPM